MGARLVLCVAIVSACGLLVWRSARAGWRAHSAEPEPTQLAAAPAGARAIEPRLQTGLAHASQPEPGTTLDGRDARKETGWVRGRVVAESAQIERTQIVLFLRRADVVIEVGGAMVGADGRFSTWVSELARLSPAAVCAAEIFAQARLAGCRPALESVEFDRESGAFPPLELELEPGPALLGRVLDSDGLALAAARVEVGGGFVPVWSDRGGRFEAPLPLSAQSLCVEAAGSAFAELALPPSEVAGDRQLGDVVLPRTGALRGRAWHADGSRAAGVPLRFERGRWSGRLDSGPGGRLDGEIAWQPVQERSVRPRLDGSFEVTGLAAGQWRARAPLSIDAELELDGPPLDLWVEGTWLVVRVRDERGEPVIGAELEIEDLERVEAELRPTRPARLRTVQARGPDALAAVHVEPHARLAVRFVSPCVRLREELCRTGPPGSRTEMIWTAVSVAAPARLVVTVQSESGAACAHWRAELCAPRTGAVLASFTERDLELDGSSPALAPGAYVLKLTPRADSDLADEFSAGLELPLELEPGRTDSLTLVAPQGGRLELALPDSRPTHWPRDPRLTRVGSDRPIATRWLDAQGRAIEFERGLRTQSRLRASEVLLAGDYRLEWQLGDRLEELCFSIERGRVTSLEPSLP